MKPDEQMYAVYFIPSLVKLNGQKCEDVRKQLSEQKKKLESKITSFWNERRATADERKFNVLKKECLKKFTSQISSKDKNHRLFMLLLNDLINFTGDEWFRQVEKQILDERDDSSDYNKVKYTPEVFIRCHCSNDNPRDSRTEVTCLTFIPHSDYPNSSLVASCGGNSICLIDPSASTVVARYTHPSKDEKLTCLTWTISDDEETILASAGVSGCINLINICNFSCYFRWNGHDESITALEFHPCKSNYLFSASLDKCIKIWNVADYELCKDFVPILQVDASQAITTFAYSPDFDLLLAGGERGLVVYANVFTSVTTSSNALMAGTTRGAEATITTTTPVTTKMTTRKRPSASSTYDVSEATRPRRQNRSSASTRSIKENVTNGNANGKGISSSNLPLKALVKAASIDSLAILPSHPGFVAVKTLKERNIFIWSIGDLKQSTISSHRPSRSATVSGKRGNSLPEITVNNFITFKYSPSVFNATNITATGNLLACGDGEGNIWMFDLGESLSKQQWKAERMQEEVKASNVLPWPTPDLDRMEAKSVEDERSERVTTSAAVKCLAFSSDLSILASGTSANLICFWKMHK